MAGRNAEADPKIKRSARRRASIPDRELQRRDNARPENPPETCLGLCNENLEVRDHERPPLSVCSRSWM